ncbi:LPXTG cell wall anchor domain-containing protein [Lacticaseibacillus hulanensis]|uniref:LPXTG cell wall anchor domain-containing protein n=1 Tax=Lacticaseibacillus hulanensis TaxID=2493111 RepID=UPI0013E362AA|nr:LPXTG cell wall anchor domain-containing protein [Lacticaseibacillus hulanensis]
MNKTRILITIATVLLFAFAVVRTVVYAADSTAQVEVVGDNKLPDSGKLPDTGGTPAASSGNHDGRVHYADALPGTKAGTYKRVYVKNTVTTMHHLPQTGNGHDYSLTGAGMVLLALTSFGVVYYRREISS